MYKMLKNLSCSALLLLVGILISPQITNAQETSAVFQGSVIIGVDTRTANTLRAGTLRFSSSTGSCNTTPTTYNTSGANTYNAPSGCTSVLAQVWGGGAGGAAGFASVGGAGGGGGGFSQSIVAVVGGNTYNLFVGAGGSSGAGAGQDSWFVDASTVMAKGGSGTTGGAAASGIGDVKYSGGNAGGGGFAQWGGGGGGAGSTANGGNGANGSPGTGGANNGGNGGGMDGAGTPAGGGGGGGNPAVGPGGAGGRGLVILTPQAGGGGPGAGIQLNDGLGWVPVSDPATTTCDVEAHNTQSTAINASQTTYTLSSYDSSQGSSNDMLVVTTHHVSNAVAPTSVTYGGDPLTMVESTHNLTGNATSMWVLLDASRNTYAGDIVVTYPSAPTRAAITAVTLSCAKQEIPQNFQEFSWGSLSLINNDLTTAEDGSIVIDTMTSQTGLSLGITQGGSGQTELERFTWGLLSSGGTSYNFTSTAGLITMGWSLSILGNGSQIIAEIERAAPSGGGTCVAPAETYTTAGAAQTTIPAGCTSAIAEVWGAGGGGADGTGGFGHYGGGGGGGAYALGAITGLTPGNTLNYTVGAGGDSETVGDDSFVVNASTVMAKGGGAANDASAGSGGTATASVGSTKYIGGNGAGGSSFPFLTNAGGGGGAAGTAANGSNGTGNTGGNGGASGGGNGGNSGNAGVGPGGGGGGSTSGAGNAGADGRVTITWGD